MSQIRSEVVFLGQTYEFSARWFNPKWEGVLRSINAKYRIVHDESVTIDDIIEDAYVVFNAPNECLNEKQLRRRGDYRGPALSVGDIVQVWRGGVLHSEALCLPQGWDVHHIQVEVV